MAERRLSPVEVMDPRNLTCVARFGLEIRFPPAGWVEEDSVRPFDRMATHGTQGPFTLIMHAYAVEKCGESALTQSDR